MFRGERDKWMSLLEAEREAARKERQELLNRIAQPEHIRVDAPIEAREPQSMSQDDLELSFIGREVPDGASVGSLRDDG